MGWALYRASVEAVVAVERGRINRVRDGTRWSAESWKCRLRNYGILSVIYFERLS